MKAGGPTVLSTDGGPDWEGGSVTGGHTGSGYSVNTGVVAPTGGMLYANRDVSIPGYMDQGVYEGLFSHERYDRGELPEMDYVIPISNGDYVVNLYMGNFCNCTRDVGERIFDIAIEGTVVRSDLDLITE
ncbi:malectin domain-containing carbohydrate-binding protein, partial [uncultured Croceitalea sp.]|uniref:malectin domain-containing carbohydrate-binding protein n=1 Tax=uncultured Croceitalea sp. TaxID=1798908 RepID=UPI0033061815